METKTIPKATEAPARFSIASRERFAGTFGDKTLLLGAAQQTYDVIDLAAGDFTAGVYITMTSTTAGNIAAAAFQADGPFSALQQVELQDPAGNTFQTYTGYELYLINLLGGYTGQGDQTLSPSYVATVGAGATGGSFRFVLRVPAELFPRDGIGALWNGSTAAQFKIKVTLAPSTSVYSTAPTTLANVRMQLNTHGYVLPGALPSGRPFLDTPPGGAIYQNWNRQPSALNAGNTVTPLTRKNGSMYRQVIAVYRNAAGARLDTLNNGDIRFTIDNVNHFKGTYELARHMTWERNRANNGLTQLPAGVVQVSFCHDWDGLTGGETRDQYVPVQPGSGVEWESNTNALGTITLLVNDVSVTEQSVMEQVVTL